MILCRKCLHLVKSLLKYQPICLAEHLEIMFVFNVVFLLPPAYHPHLGYYRFRRRTIVNMFTNMDIIIIIIINCI